MKNLLLIVFIGAIGNVQAGILEEWYPQCVLRSDSLDATLGTNQSKYTFEFAPLDGSTNQMVYSIDGVQNSKELDGNSIEIITSPGTHIFQFYYTENYYEVYTDSLNVRNQFHSIYEIRMERSDMQIMVDKPVIYLYPEEEIEVELKLTIEGTPTFFYPEYQNGWKFKASPSGDLTFGDKTYNYLFWEAAQHRTFTQEETSTGFNVRKADVITFLEEKLNLAILRPNIPIN